MITITSYNEKNFEFQKLRIEIKATRDVEFRRTLTSKMAVLPVSGELVFFCDQGKYRELHAYSWVRGHVSVSCITAPCKEIGSINILGLQINRKDYVAASCATCANIKILKFEGHEIRQNWVTVFGELGQKPRRLIQGEDDSVFVYMLQEDRDYRSECLITGKNKSKHVTIIVLSTTL